MSIAVTIDTRELTDRQLLVWLEQDLARDVPANNMVAVFTMTPHEPFDVERFRRAFFSVVARSDALRTVFAPEGAGARQRVRGELEVGMEVVDLTAAAEPERAWRAWLDARRQRALALEDRAFDTALVRRGNGVIVWYLCLHHLITDATSFVLIHRRTLEAYGGEDESELPLFADWVTRSLELAGSPEREASQRFWQERLNDRLEPVRFYGRVDRRTTAYSRRRTVALRREQLAALQHVATQQTGAFGADQAVATVFVTAVMAFVHRVSGNRRIGVGMPVANRPSRRFRATIGLFMEVVPLRAEIDAEETFASLLGKVREDLQRVLRHSRCCTSNPVKSRAYEVMVNFQTAKFEARLGPMHTELLTGTVAFAAGDAPLAEDRGAGGGEPLVVTIHDYDDRGAPVITLDCNRGVFDERTADRAAAHLVRLLDACLVDPSRRLDEIDLLADDERMAIVEGFNATHVARSGAPTVLSLFWAQVAKTPARTAVSCDTRTLDYAALAAEVDEFAARLRGRGVRRGDCLAVLLDRSPELLVALLATWRAGAAYVPLDPTHPGARLDQILDDAGPVLLLTTTRLRSTLAAREGMAVLCVDDAAAPAAAMAARAAPAPDEEVDPLAYVLFTSGSTGRPKGVEVTHAALANLLLSVAQAPGCGEGDRFLALTSVAFDIAACELFLPLLVGGTVDIVGPTVSTDGRALRAYLERHPPSIVQATPATWRMLVDCGWRGGAHLRLWSGGEALAGDLARDLLARGAELWNLYGPTETTVYSTAHRVTVADGEATVPIGRPIANTRVYVLDRCRRPLPVGVTGELFIGGAGLARGYRSQPELTRARFVPDPFVGAGTMYRTGDLAAFGDDGVLAYHGRVDRQIKLRGFRIEPAEVEAVLRTHPAVRACAVALRTVDTTPMLVAWLVGATPDVSAPDLRTFLIARLPEYMVPARLEWLAALPLTPNGKVDLAALPAPNAVRASDARFEAPTDDLERRLAKSWAEVLGVARVARHDDFFALGGDSLRAVRLLVQVRSTLGADVSLATLFAEPTVAALAAALRAGAADATGLIPLQPWGGGTPIFFLRGIHVYQPLAQRLGEGQPSYGIFLPIEERLFETGGRSPVGTREPTASDLSVEALATAYLEVIRARQPHGPYRLGGLSMGGVLAFEIAQRLRAAGEEVSLLVLLDTWLPRSRRLLFWPWTRAHLRRLCRGDFSALRRFAEPVVRRTRDWLRRLGLWRTLAWPPPEGAQITAEFDRLRMDHARRAAVRYDPHIRPYAGRVLLFRALDRRDAEGWRIEPSYGWEQVVTGRLDVVDVQGEHVGMLQPPFVDTIAAHLRAALADSAAASVAADDRHPR